MQRIGKKLCAILLVVCMLLGSLPMGVLAAEESTAAQFVAQQLNLGDDLTMHFYVAVDSAYVESATMNISVDGSAVGSYAISELTAQEDGNYEFAVDLAAAQMTDEISLSLTSDGAEIAQKTYTVQAYAQQVLTGSYTDATKALVKQMLNYGAKAQTYFAHNTGTLANAGNELETAASVPANSSAVNVSGAVEGIRFYGASLVFDSKLAVRYYFSAESLEGITFQVGDTPYDAEVKGDLYYVEIPGINPQQMDDVIELNVSKADSSLTVGYSPLYYITRMYNKGTTGEALKNLLQAIYGYYEVAEQYTGCDTYTVSFSDGAAAQTVETGCLATKPTVSKEGYYFLGWYDGDTKFDFSTPITSDVSLTAKWEAVPSNMWYSFNDSACASVWSGGGSTKTWLEEHDGEYGVLKIEKDASVTELYVGGTNSINWQTEFDQEHYKNAVALSFRVKLESDVNPNIVVQGKNFKLSGQSLKTYGLTVNGGWQDVVIPYAVYDNYDLLNGLFFYTSASGAFTLYIDEITVVEEDPFMWYSFSDEAASTAIWVNSDRASLTWHESYDGEDGVLQIDKTAAKSESYVGSTNGTNWKATFGQAHYEGATGLSFRVKLVADGGTNVVAYGKNGSPKIDSLLNHGLTINGGWQDIVLPIDVYENYDALCGMYFYTSSSGAYSLYIDEITVVYNHTVSFSDGVESQTVQTGSLATKPAVTKDGYYFMGWYDGDTKFDFSTPITSDVSLTAKWEEVPSNMWYSFNDEAGATSVWVNSDRASLTWHESYDGEDGVLQIDKTTAKTESYVGSTNSTNWVAEFDQEHYKNAVALCFRVKLVSESSANIIAYGKNGTPGGQSMLNYGLVRNGGWQDIVIPYDVYTNYDALNGMYFYTSSSGAYSLYIDEITVVEEPGDMWYGFGDDSCTGVWKSTDVNLTWLENHDGEDGVLQVDYPVGYDDRYLCKIEGGANFTPVFPQYHYEGAAGLRFRVKLVSEQSANIIANGVNWSISEQSMKTHGLVENGGWQDIVIPYDVYTNYEALSGMFFYMTSSGAFTLYFDEITVVYNHTVSFSDGVESQTVLGGTLATEPTVTKDGYYFMGWYNGDTLFDFTQPITSDISLTAKWGEGVDNTWYSFNNKTDATSVWIPDGVSLNWHASFDGHDGVLQINKTSAEVERYIGKTEDNNWIAQYEQAHYEGATALSFRVRLVSEKRANIIAIGKSWGIGGQTVINSEGDSGWVDVVIPYDVYTNYDILNGLFLYTSSSGNWTLYIDQITAVYETEA